MANHIETLPGGQSWIKGPLRDLGPACSLARGRTRLERLISIHHLLCHCLFLVWQFVTLATQVSAVGEKPSFKGMNSGAVAGRRTPVTHRSEISIPREKPGQIHHELASVTNGLKVEPLQGRNQEATQAAH